MAQRRAVTQAVRSIAASRPPPGDVGAAGHASAYSLLARRDRDAWRQIGVRNAVIPGVSIATNTATAANATGGIAKIYGSALEILGSERRAPAFDHGPTFWLWRWLLIGCESRTG
jgi:hypothetical protein